MDNKITDWVGISRIVQNLRSSKPYIKIVTTCGAFDMLHAGHLSSLRKAKSFGDILIVCLNSDLSIKGYKSTKRPIISQNYRAEMLAGLEAVDYVVLFEETTPNNLLEVIKPNFHVKSKMGFKGVETETVEKNGGKIELIEDIPGLSTTNIIKKILEVESSEN